MICGADEAGRGPMAGPVVAAAVVLPKDFDVSLLGDSKALSERERIAAEKEIKEKAIACSVNFIDAEEIDRINILNASLKAMALSYAECKAKTQIDILLVDGNRLPPVDGVRCECIVKGDAKIYEIMAASILAKRARDDYMRKMAEIYPGYGFERNFGYPTKEHKKAMERLGLSPIHRKSFRFKDETMDLPF